MLLPNAIGSFISFFLNFSFIKISLNKTPSLVSLGISMPTVFLPGITATLVDVELVFLAISSDRFIIFETFIPGAGSNSYKLTTGPLLIFFIFPSIPKSIKTFSINSESGLFPLRSSIFFFASFLTNKSIEGNLKFFTF